MNHDMKRAFVRALWRRHQSRSRQTHSAFRTFLILSLSSMAVFILLGIFGQVQRAAAPSPLQSMKGLAASLSGSLFRSLLAMELPHMITDRETSPLEAGQMALFLVRFLTDLNPADPTSLLAREMPGADVQPSVLLRPGSGGRDEAPQDFELLPVGQGGGQSSFFYPPDDPSLEELEEQKDETESLAPLADDPARHKAVFIYHSHNRESYLPELGPGAKDPSHSKINVTLVGKRLARQLEARGVGAVASSKDYASSVKSYNWNLSYKYSRQTVQQAMAGYENLEYFFDIHRDSQRRSKTTVTIDGKDYAQVYFIIGHKNPNWKQNESFASKIHEKLEERYPGLSRGIWGKSAANGNGEYNQSMAPNSVLIEIGGIENTLEECYRTADILAEVIAEIYWESRDARKADSPAYAQIHTDHGRVNAGEG
jgi:stage II sporulation protein P